MRKLHNFLKLVALSNQCSSFSQICRSFSSHQIDGEMDNKVSIILSVVTMILSCYIVEKLFSKVRLVIISITRYRDIDRGFVQRTISWRPYIVRYRARTHVSRVRCSHTAAAASASD